MDCKEIITKYRGVKVKIQLFPIWWYDEGAMMPLWSEGRLSEATIMLGTYGLSERTVPIFISTFLHELGHLHSKLTKPEPFKWFLQTRLSNKARQNEEVQAWIFAWSILAKLGLLTEEVITENLHALASYFRSEPVDEYAKEIKRMSKGVKEVRLW